MGYRLLSSVQCYGLVAKVEQNQKKRFLQKILDLLDRFVAETIDLAVSNHSGGPITDDNIHTQRQNYMDRDIFASDNAGFFGCVNKTAKNVPWSSRTLESPDRFPYRPLVKNWPKQASKNKNAIIIFTSTLHILVNSAGDWSK